MSFWRSCSTLAAASLLLWAAPVSGSVLVELHPTLCSTMHVGPVEGRIDGHLHLGLGQSLALNGTHFGAIVGTDYYTLTMWSSPDDSAPRTHIWQLLFECENERTYAGRSTITSRVHIISGGGDAIDFLTTEATLQAVPHFGAANREGQVPVEQKRIAGSLIVGRHLGPVTLRLGITSTSHWQASIALPLQLLDHYGSGRMRRLP